jgi:serine/threonine-protein kinase
MALPALVPPENLLGNYRIMSRLAAGGMGVVYKAFDEKLQRKVALKFLSVDSALTAADRNRLLQEARAASALDHENIASIHAVEEAGDGKLFIVMGFYEGENLATRMSHAPLTIDQSVSVIRQIAQGLAHAHAHNVIHRDIKPSNVILCSDGVTKIVDFGLARVVSEDATQSIGVSGTLPYMSPEQVTGKNVDRRTDIWSLGVVMYELLTHRYPFPVENPAMTITAIAKAQPAPMENVPEALQMIVYRAIAKRPEDRYQNCLEMLRDLKLFEATRAGATITLDTRELRQRIRSAGGDQHKVLPTRTSWSFAVVIILAVAALFISVRTNVTVSRKAMQKKFAAQSASPTAYDAYQKGIDLVQHYYRKNALSQAIELLNSSVKADPRFALAHVALGEAYFRRFQLERDKTLIDEAEKECKTALAIDEQLPDVHIMLARVQLAKGNPGLALTEAQRAIDLDPNNSRAYLALADIYDTQGRSAEAETTYQHGIALSPENWEGYHRLGSFYYYQRRFEESAQQHRRELELVPNQVYARTNLALDLKALGRKEEAEAELKKALEYQLVFAAYGNLANLYNEQGRFSEAIELTKRALQDNPNNYTAWNNLGTYYEEIGDKKNAAEADEHTFSLLKEQIKLSPRDATMRSDLAMQYAKRHMPVDAIANLNAALALQSKAPRALQIAGDIYCLLGDKQKAKSYLRDSILAGNSVETLAQDPDLRSLMADPKVREELNRVQKKTESTAANKTAR